MLPTESYRNCVVLYLNHVFKMFASLYIETKYNTIMHNHFITFINEVEDTLQVMQLLRNV